MVDFVHDQMISLLKVEISWTRNFDGANYKVGYSNFDAICLEQCFEFNMNCLHCATVMIVWRQAGPNSK